MNYRIVVIPGNPQYNLYGISFGKNKGTYWANKSARNINEVIVIFNNKNVIGINDNQICISLHGIKNINDQKQCLKIFCEQLRGMGLDVKTIRFKFVIADKREEELVNNIITSLGLNGSVLNFDVANKNINSNDELRTKEDKIEKKIEDKFKKDREITGSSNMSNIVKYDNSVRKDKNTAYDMSKSTLSMAEAMKAKYEELMKDPLESEKLFSMTDEEVIKYVSNLVTMDNKKYYMDNDSKSNKDNMNKTERATVDVASKYNGVSNTELGIAGNDFRYSEHKFSAVEENNDDVRVVSPDSSSVGMNDSKTVTTSYSEDDSMSNNVSTIKDSGDFNEEERKESSLKNLPLQNTVTFHPSNSNTYSIGSKSKTKVRKLVKPRNNDVGEKSAAFISLPVIIFIISLLLLIGSGIIWFITK